MRIGGLCAAVLMLALLARVAHPQGYAFYSGAELFQRFCATCHGASGRGDGLVASSLAVLVPDLTRLSQTNGSTFPALQIRELIDGRAVLEAHGPRFMPVWGYEFWVEEGADVVAEQGTRMIIDKLLEYLRTIQVEVDSAEPGR